MDNPPDIKPGDRVRVVLEGDVRPSTQSEKHFAIGEGIDENYITVAAKHVASIEVLAKPAKMGDEFRPAEDTARADALPNGTILRQAETGCLQGKCDGQWYTIGSSAPYLAEHMAVPRTIVYLPE